MTNEAIVSGNAKILYPPVNAIKMTEPVPLPLVGVGIGPNYMFYPYV